MKLNSDGSSLGNPGQASAGGVIRDNCGRLCMAYSVHLGIGSNNFAEMRSLLEGVRRCHQMGFYKVEIESDSHILVNWIIKGECNIWYLEDYWDELSSYLTCMDYRVGHVYREGNCVADFLAKQGARGLNKDWPADGDLPSHLRGLLRMDRLGFPYLRIS